VLEALRISAEVVNNLPMKRAVEEAACESAKGLHRQVARKPESCFPR